MNERSIRVALDLGRVRGFVGDYEVISVSKLHGETMVGTSSCLPVDWERAKLYIECMRQVVAKVEELESQPRIL